VLLDNPLKRIAVMIEGLVSVIIPTYNRAHIIQRCIDSALSQTYPNLEIVVVDDGSKDNTKEIIDTHYSDNPKVNYFSKQNGGVSSARNLGLSVAKGEFVAFLDSDDFWMPEKIDLQVKCLQKHPDVGLVWTEFFACDLQGKVIHERYLRKMYGAYRFFPTPMNIFSKQFTLNTLIPNKAAEAMFYYVGHIYSPMALGNLVHTSTVVIRKHLIDKAGGFDETFSVAEDYDLYLRISALTEAAFIDEPLMGYCINEDDALTSKKHHLAIATNYLKILERSLNNQRQPINLPPSMIKQCLADAYRWVGGEYAYAKQFSKSFFYFCNSLMVKPTSLETYKNITKLFLHRLGLKHYFN
jgi:glycosyltransferase involved in cell wall biosynthesis